MNKFRFTVKIFAIALFMFAFASLAQAQATRTWVSGVGDDANPCSRTAPCKTFAGAISKTAACGEISVLDPGGFGAVTITKSITIDGTGTLAGILASLTTGVIVNAAATDVITIRGLSINGACNGIRGMNILQAKAVNVEDCVIFRFANEGILINTTGAVFLQVTNTVIRDNTGDGISAVTTLAGPGRVRGSLDRVRLSGNGQNGLHAKSGSSFTVRNSVFASNVANGIFCDAATTVFAGVTVSASQIWGSGQNGVRAGNAGNLGGSGVQISQNQIEGNSGNGVLVSTGGVVNTFSNNDILGNGTDGCPGCTNVAPGS
jgi:hypothetical protein